MKVQFCIVARFQLLSLSSHHPSSLSPPHHTQGFPESSFSSATPARASRPHSHLTPVGGRGAAFPHSCLLPPSPENSCQHDMGTVWRSQRSTHIRHDICSHCPVLIAYSVPKQGRAGNKNNSALSFYSLAIYILELVFVPPLLSLLSHAHYLPGVDHVCVQSMDGQLSFFRNENAAFSCFLPDFLLPGPLRYLPRTDSLLTTNSARMLQTFR